MVRRALALLVLLAALAQAHPGDHAYLRLQVRGNQVRAELELPGHVLAALDRNGDFLISPEEIEQGDLEPILRSGLQLESRGVQVTPAVEPLPRKLWRPSSNADAPIGLALSYRWPWEVRGLELTYQLFAKSPAPDCSVTVHGLGPLIRVKLSPQEPRASFGAPEPDFSPGVVWFGFLHTLTTPLGWAPLLAMAAGSRGRRSWLAYLLGVPLGALAGVPWLAGPILALPAAGLALAGRSHPLWLSLLLGVTSASAGNLALAIGNLLCQALLGAVLIQFFRRILTLRSSL